MAEQKYKTVKISESIEHRAKSLDMTVNEYILHLQRIVETPNKELEENIYTKLIQIEERLKVMDRLDYGFEMLCRYNDLRNK